MTQNVEQQMYISFSILYISGRHISAQTEVGRVLHSKTYMCFNCVTFPSISCGIFIVTVWLWKLDFKNILEKTTKKKPCAINDLFAVRNSFLRLQQDRVRRTKHPEPDCKSELQSETCRASDYRRQHTNSIEKTCVVLVYTLNSWNNKTNQHQWQ